MSEIKQAVELMRKFEANGNQSDKGEAGATMSAALTLSHFYLAEHPADEDVLIDFDDGTWQQGVGFGEPTINGWPILFDNGGCDPIEVWLDYDGKVALIQSNTNDHVLIGTKIKTRGQLRSLCAALGIPLKQPDQT